MRRLRTGDKEPRAHLPRGHPWERPDPAPGGLGTGPCPLQQRELIPHPSTGDLVSFCAPIPLGKLRGLGGGGLEAVFVLLARGDKVGPSHPPQDLALLSFSAFLKAGFCPERLHRPKVTSPSDLRGVVRQEEQVEPGPQTGLTSGPPCSRQPPHTPEQVWAGNHPHHHHHQAGEENLSNPLLGFQPSPRRGERANNPAGRVPPGPPSGRCGLCK